MKKLWRLVFLLVVVPIAGSAIVGCGGDGTDDNPTLPAAGTEAAPDDAADEGEEYEEEEEVP